MTNAKLHGCAFEGWQCFHCGEIFTTVGGAQDHFGADPNKEPGCMIRVQLGEERGLLMALRKAERHRKELMMSISEAVFNPTKESEDIILSLIERIQNEIGV